MDASGIYSRLIRPLDRDRLEQSAGVVLPPLLTFVVGLVVVGSGSLRSLPYLAVALVLIVSQPVAVPLMALLICQEVDNGDTAGTSVTTTLGNAFYYGPNSGSSGSAAPGSSSQLVLPVVALMAAAAGVAILRLIREHKRGVKFLDPFGVAVIAVMVSLVIWTAVIGRVAAGSVVQALNQEARPFLLIVCGFILGLILPTSRPARRSTFIGVGLALLILACLVAFGIATGGVTLDLESQNSPFYDAALPAVTGAVVLALLFSRERDGWWSRMIVLTAALVITVTSLRRNVWLGMGIVLVIAFIAAYGRGRAARRLGLGLVAAVPLLLAVPDIASALGSRLYETFFSLGDNADKSAQGHVSDIDLGWRYAVEAPLAGIGSRHSQLPGAAAADANVIYLHNEWLLDWLRYGIIGVVLVTAFMGLLAVGAIMTFRRGAASLPQTAAAMFVLMVPISCVTAPFLSTTNRWPSFVGIAAGVLVAGRVASRRAQTDPLHGLSDPPGEQIVAIPRPHDEGIVVSSSLGRS